MSVIRFCCNFPSRFPSCISGRRLEYDEHQNVLKLVEYHSKEIASNVSVDNVSVVSFLIFLL